MNLKQLEAFVCVADTGSFSEAAKILFLTQPTISSHIAGLEKELNALLLIRNTRGVRLSDRGKELYALAKQMLDMEQQVKYLFGVLDTDAPREIRIAASTIPGQCILPKMLADFSKQNSDISYEMIGGDSENVIQQVMEGKADIGFAGTPAEENSRCKSIPFYKDELVILTPPDERFARFKEEEFDIEILYREPWILREAGSGTRKETERFLQKRGIDIKDLQVVASMNNPESIKTSISYGMGITIMSRVAAEDVIQDEKVFAFSFPKDPFVRDLQIIYLDDFTLSPPTQKLLQFAQEYQEKK